MATTPTFEQLQQGQEVFRVDPIGPIKVETIDLTERVVTLDVPHLIDRPNNELIPAGTILDEVKKFAESIQATVRYTPQGNMPGPDKVVSADGNVTEDWPK